MPPYGTFADQVNPCRRGPKWRRLDEREDWSSKTAFQIGEMTALHSTQWDPAGPAPHLPYPRQCPSPAQGALLQVPKVESRCLAETEPPVRRGVRETATPSGVEGSCKLRRKARDAVASERLNGWTSLPGGQKCQEQLRCEAL